MPTLSDRSLDALANPANAACREGNLRVLREAAYLLWEDGERKRLRCDWCELMGETGWLTLELLEREGVLVPGGRLHDPELARRRPDAEVDELLHEGAHAHRGLTEPETGSVLRGAAGSREGAMPCTRTTCTDRNWQWRWLVDPPFWPAYVCGDCHRHRQLPGENGGYR